MRWAVAVVAAWASLAQGQDYGSLAERIVGDSARIAEGETVLIRGHVRDQVLLEDLAIRVRAAGGFPVLSYTSDHLLRGMADQVPERFDNQLNATDIKLAPTLSAVISVESTDSPSLLNDIPAPRMAARAKADAAYADLLRRLGVRQVLVGNGLYPTAALANQYAVTTEQISRVFYRALEAEPSGLHATGEMVRMVVGSGAQVHVTNPNGTDLKFRVEGRPVRIADGLPPEEGERGARLAPICLPAGEAMIVPVPGSAEGRVVIDSLTYRGRDISALSLNIKAGKVQGMNARTGLDALRPLYDAAPPGKEAVAYLDLGLNGLVALPAGIKPAAPMAYGMVSVGIGSGFRAGGENPGAFELLLPLPGSTVVVGETTLVDRGTLVMPTSPDVGEVTGPEEPQPDEKPKADEKK